MKSNYKTRWPFVLLWIIILIPTTARSAEIIATIDGEFYRLITQIKDIESLKRTIQDCYRTEKRILEVSRPSGQSSNYSTRLDGELVNRVFGHLAHTPEHERFIKAYSSLVKRSNYRESCTAELFGEYMKLLQSGRARLMSQLQRYLETAPHVGSDKPYNQRVLLKPFPRPQSATVSVPRGLRTSN
ncbi:MAG: hypothetical protein ACLQT6_05960 [Desulfomonilaceae bacterium]